MRNSVRLTFALVFALVHSAWADFEVYFLRHGETSWNRAKILQGSIDYTRLTPKGRKMAERTAEGMVSAGIGFDRIYSSPYLRAKTTADIVAKGLKGGTVHVDRRLREVGLGKYEGVRYEKGKWPDDNLRCLFEDSEAFVPQGEGAESFDMVQERLRDFLNGELKPLDGQVQRILCVAHSLVLKSLVREFAGESASAAARAAIQRNCCVHMLRYSGGRFSLVETGKVFYDPAEFDRMTMPLMVAHRGAGDLTMPEASRAAFSNAVETVCDIVKLDLQTTRDGKIVLSHDPMLKRSMGWDVKISTVDYADILEKPFLERGGFGNEKIVRLDEALDIAKSIPQFWIDFKHFNQAFAEQVLAEFDRQGIDRSRIMIATFTTKALEYMQKRHPEVRRVGHIAPKRIPEVMDYCERLGLYGVNMPVQKEQTTLDDIRRLKAKGIWVSTWFVQDEARAKKYGGVADAFVTDHVSEARKIDL